ncbi:MAG: hypothetical protein ABI409_17400 [Ramlibacter sp.]
MEPGSGSVQEKEKARLAEIIDKVNDLFEGDLSDDDRLVYVNNVIKGKLLESEVLAQQANNNTKEQFSNSPDLAQELLGAIMDALEAHSTMSRQALDSIKVRNGMKDVLLGPGPVVRGIAGPRPTHDRHDLSKAGGAGRSARYFLPSPMRAAPSV